MSDALMNASNIPGWEGNIAPVLQTMEMMIQETGIAPHELQRIEIPGGKNTNLLVPGLSADPESVPEVEGTIVFLKSVRFYYEGEYTGGGEPPTCASYLVTTNDGTQERGRGNPGGVCDQCPLAEFQPGGEAPPCKRKQAVYLRMEGSIPPYLLLVPPTGLKNMRNYMLRLFGHGLMPHHVVTRFRLQSDKNAAGQIFPRLAPPEVARPLTVEERKNAEEYAKLVQPWLRDAQIEDSEPPPAD